MNRRGACACFLCAWSLSGVAGAAEVSFPMRPIRLIAPSSAGGPVDVIARILSQGYGEALGQQIVVDNRAGAAGLIGTELVAKATPDGYTLLFGFSGPLVIVPRLNATPAPYDSLKDFAHVLLTSMAPYVLLVNAVSPAKSVQELVALAKALHAEVVKTVNAAATGDRLAEQGVESVWAPRPKRSQRPSARSGASGAR